ncbi:hypothetical protein PAPHI01_2831, partial [Pancytospora philotis]
MNHFCGALYMSSGAARQLNSTPRSVKVPVHRYAVDDRKITFSEYTTLTFMANGVSYTENFLILPQMQRFKVLIGKKWLVGNRRTDSTCEYEIRTPEGKRVVEATYALPKKLEEGTAEA